VSVPGIDTQRLRTGPLLAAGLVFAVLATANAGGYRYGSSDQAFYIPAVTRVLDPASFPRDGTLIDAQAALIVVDEVLGAIVGVTGLSTEATFFAGYLLSLAVTWAGLAAIGSRVFTSTWVTFALGAAFTMRHRIARTSANTFEPYFHPRMLAFGLGMLAIGALLRRRNWAAVGLVALAAVIHVTTALWFAVLLGVALVVLDRSFRGLALVGAGLGLVALGMAVAIGPLRGMATVMDAVWLQAVASKDSLFADEWPVWAWVSNVGLIVVLWAAHLVRKRRGTATMEDRALVWGATALFAVFIVTLPFVMARLSLVVEFQISRVFWLLDLLATVYLLAALTESRFATRHVGVPIAAALIAISASRALYVTLVEHPERALVAIRTPASPWEDAMAWIARQPSDVHVLADPGHGWRFGTSVRVSAGRDVFLEEVKDSALAIYSRDVAGRVVERTAAVGDFSTITPERVRALASRYDLDLLVTERAMSLPLAYQNSRFHIYRLSDVR
jgi:hypothetical protein